MTKYLFPYQETMIRSGSLIFFYLSLDQNLKKLHNSSSWYDPKLSKRDNKGRMKHFGGTLNSYEIHMYENLFLGSQKLIEDFIYNFKKCGGPNVKIWDKDYDKEESIHVLRTINAVSNIIKHTCSLVKYENRKREKHAGHLVSNGFCSDGAYLQRSNSWDALKERYGFPKIVYLTMRGIYKLMTLNVNSEDTINWPSHTLDVDNDGYKSFLNFSIPENFHEDFKEYWP